MIDRPSDTPSDGENRRATGPADKDARARYTFAAVTGRFIREIDSLQETLPLAMLSIGDAHKTATERLRKFIEERGTNRDSTKGTADIHVDDLLRFQSLVHRAGRTSAAHALVPRSFLVSLVSQYDAFVGSLIQVLLYTKPEILNASEKVLTFADLVAFGSIENAREQIIEKEVESVLRKSHSEQFDWLESKFKIKLRQELAIWPTFVEITERRNLFVHTGGHVSAQYLQNCAAHNVDCRKVKRGQPLNVTPQYFRDAYEAIFEIGVKLAHVFWRKLKPEDRTAADNHLVSVSYNLLAEGKYVLAQRLLDFATDVLREYASAEHRLRFVVNRVQAYKWAGEAQKAKAILDEEDFSALSDQFRLAAAALQDDVPLTIELVKQIGPKGAISLGDYREWPLFRELRKQPVFVEAIQEVFGQPLSQVKVTPPPDQALANGEQLLDAPPDVPKALSPPVPRDGETPEGDLPKASA